MTKLSAIAKLYSNDSSNKTKLADIVGSLNKIEKYEDDQFDRQFEKMSELQRLNYLETRIANCEESNFEKIANAFINRKLNKTAQEYQDNEELGDIEDEIPYKGSLDFDIPEEHNMFDDQFQSFEDEDEDEAEDKDEDEDKDEFDKISDDEITEEEEDDTDETPTEEEEDNTDETPFDVDDLDLSDVDMSAGSDVKMAKLLNSLKLFARSIKK